MLRLDESLKSFLTDEDGKLLLDQDKNPIASAVDLLTGTSFKKICESVADRDPKVLSDKLEALAKSGVQHYSSEDSHFRGYWAPVNAAA